MNDVTIYKPEEVAETPFPQGVAANSGEAQDVTGSSGQKTYSPVRIVDQSPPTPRIATELLSTQLNTHSRKVTGELQFTLMGGFQIGDYKDGISGDLRISRNGIVARNKLGSNTVVIDGDGNAYFAGEIQSGSMITGILLLGDGDIQINGIDKRMVFYDEDTGLASIVIGKR